MSEAIEEGRYDEREVLRVAPTAKRLATLIDSASADLE
jgi:hypothetical protein